MKKSILTIFVLLATTWAVNAQSDNKKEAQQEIPTKKETTATDKEFQNQKAEEAKQKQEAKRKAMKEKARQKEQEAKNN